VNAPPLAEPVDPFDVDLGADLSPPVAARLSEISASHAVGGEAARSIATLLRLIAVDPQAPTTVRDPAVAVDQHVADALVALDLDAVRGARTAADIGAGAGLPGLALAAALADCQWWLVDSVKRKTAFMQRAITAMGLANARTINLRTENWREGRLANDLVTARAVAPAPVVLEYAAPLLRLGGSLVDWRTRMDGADETDARAATRVLGLELAESRPVVPFPGAHSRYLYVYVKVQPTPDRFPRRAGTARKRPLAGST